ncbi:MAG: SH3 domain-containing protein [Bacteroidota bacterium]
MIASIRNIALACCGFLLLMACQPQSPADDPPPVVETDTPPTNPAPSGIASTPQEYEVVVDQLRLRDAPGIEGKVITELSRGTRLLDLGEISDFTTKVKLRGIAYDEPWIKVKTSDGQEGWIFPGGLKMLNTSLSEANRAIIDRRLQAMFGVALSNNIAAYRGQFESAKDDASFAVAYDVGERLRDTMVRVLENYAVYEDEYTPQDLFWLNHALPGYVTSLAAEGTQYYLFCDFKAMGRKASQTTGSTDDAFVQLNYSIHPLDSVGYFFPVWFMQTWDYGGHSLLGKGHHFDVLQQMEALHQRGPLFKKPLAAIKAKLLEDITADYVEYWQSQEEILAELRRIQEADFTILSQADKVAIATRAKMFEHPEDNNIRVNLRAG